MRAIICTKYGPPEVLHPREVAKPAPRANEVLIKIKATTCFAACTETFDVVLDAIGKLERRHAKRLAGADGRRLSVASDVGPIARITTAELELLIALVEAGKLRTFIDRQYALEQIREAHAYVGQWHKRGPSSWPSISTSPGTGLRPAFRRRAGL